MPPFLKSTSEALKSSRFKVLEGRSFRSVLYSPGWGHWPRSRLSTVTAQSRILAALPAPWGQMQEAAVGMDRELLGSGPKSQTFPPDQAHGTAPLPHPAHLFPSLAHLPGLEKCLEFG